MVEKMMIDCRSRHHVDLMRLIIGVLMARQETSFVFFLNHKNMFLRKKDDDSSRL